MTNIAIIGAGHNALTCATLLAQKGYNVSLFEGSDRCGGGLSTIQLGCGCRINRYANQLNLLDRKVQDILEQTTGTDISNLICVPQKQTKYHSGVHSFYFLSDDTVETIAKRAAAFEPPTNTIRYLRDLTQASELVSDLWTNPIPNKTDFINRLSSARKGFEEYFLNGSLISTAEEYFQSDFAKQLFVASQSLVSTDLEARGTALCLLYLDSGNARFAPNYAVPLNGMVDIAEIFAAAAENSGVKIHLNQRARKIDVANDTVKSVEFENGESISEFEGYIFGFSPIRVHSLIEDVEKKATLNEELPYETGAVKIFATVPREHPSVVDLFREGFPFHAYHAGFDQFVKKSRRAHFSSDFDLCFIEIMVDELATSKTNCTKHVALSIYAGFFPYNSVTEGRCECIVAAITQIIRRQLSEILDLEEGLIQFHSIETSADFEDNLGMYRGDVDHGSFAFGNQFERRGALGGSKSSLLRNLWNCSAGVFPGGLISGRAGWSCALRIDRELSGDCEHA